LFLLTLILESRNFPKLKEKEKFDTDHQVFNKWTKNNENVKFKFNNVNDPKSQNSDIKIMIDVKNWDDEKIIWNPSWLNNASVSAPSGIWNQKQQRKNQKTLKPLSNTTLFIQGKMDQKMKRLFKPIIFSIRELFNQLLNILYD
jgi:hypothetical protein